MMKNKWLCSLLTVLVVVTSLSCSSRQTQPVSTNVGGAGEIQQFCDENHGRPRIEQISGHVWAAMGFELANTMLIHTEAGNVIVDTSICPAAARAVKKMMDEKAPPGPVKAIIYTHSHVDHTMGASVWAGPGTQIWATDTFMPHFFKQYSVFLKAETARGMRQHAYHLSRDEVPCSTIGPIMRVYSLDDIGSPGVLMPTDTFSGVKVLDIGGLRIELHEAQGETHDTLFVWVPEDKTLLCADNYYNVFPNLYTIRGTSPRPVDDWIRSIDSMRRLEAEHLMPGHTKPVHGKQEIALRLTSYRDAIQYVRDEVIRRANRGEDIDTIAESIRLPAQLASRPDLREGYGQIDWSARAIYTNNLGWFDGRADKLYPMKHCEAARREIELMGGADKIMKQADRALKEGDNRWVVHLLAKLKDSGLLSGNDAKELDEKLAQAYRQLASGIFNTNGRAYLLESALELTQGVPPPAPVKLNPEFAEGMPLEHIFNNMPPLLDTGKASGVYECVRFVFPDVNRQFNITLRNSVAEVIEGDPLAGTPVPIATVTVDSLTYKQIALKMLDAGKALAEGRMKVEGSFPAFLIFMGRFQASIG